MVDTVLTFARFFLPGYQAGGPIVSLNNLFAALGDEVNFRLVTSDRDIMDDRPYASVASGAWSPVGKASVLYLAPGDVSLELIGGVARQLEPEALYLNSFFDTRFTLRVLAARRLGRLPSARLILAPRGEFSAGALSLKSARKNAYIASLKTTGLLNDVEWHASTPFEAGEIRAALGRRATRHIHVAPDLGAMPLGDIPEWQPRAADEPFRVCFLSRISPMKNLGGAISALAHMRSPTIFTVYGPIEDEAYWQKCLRESEGLPAHVSVVYEGSLDRAAVHTTIARQDAFFLPTFGENYGHVIPEALSVGLPVVISDQTPWKGLAEKGVGYDGRLDDRAFARELDKLASLDARALGAMRLRCQDYARSVITSVEAVAANRRIFAPAAH